MQERLAYLLMLVAGIGIPVMAALNASLGVRLQSPLAAVAVLSGVALVFTLCLMMMQPPVNWRALFSTPPAMLFAGILFVLYIGGITWCSPRIGLGNAVLMVLVGQLVSSALIDHFGLAGATVAPITVRRIVGLSLVVIGAFLARRQLINP